MGSLVSALVFKNGTDKITEVPPSDLFGITAKDIDGKERVLKEFYPNKKAFVFVNVASSWGLTSLNYTQLSAMYEKYSSKGLEIFGFPCNQFMSQESGSEDEIKKFVQKEFNVKFPMFSKIEVNGPKTHMVYKYLKYNTPKLRYGNAYVKEIAWNFGKFLVDNKGQIIGYWEPKQEPNELIPSIEKLLS